MPSTIGGSGGSSVHITNELSRWSPDAIFRRVELFFHAPGPVVHSLRKPEVLQTAIPASMEGGRIAREGHAWFPCRKHSASGGRKHVCLLPNQERQNLAHQHQSWTKHNVPSGALWSVSPSIGHCRQWSPLPLQPTCLLIVPAEAETMFQTLSLSPVSVSF